LSKHQPIVILGAGLQGACIALELARRGIEVVLLDQDDKPINRTSLRSEGKIHLGLVYANDHTFATAALMLQGSLHFHYLLSKWLGSAIDQLSYSTPFYYLVADDSILSLDELANHYAAVETEYHRLLTQAPQLNYLGKLPGKLYRPLATTELATYFQASLLQGGFQTAELAVDTEQLAIIVRHEIDRSPTIQFLPSRQVKAVERGNGSFYIEGVSPDGIWKMEAQQVVNATWQNRLAIDRSVGLEYADEWLYRLKYRVVAKLPDAFQGAPSVTMVIGRYGDVVIRPNQTVYLSWYPVALKGWSHDLQPPSSWEAPCLGEVDPSYAQELATDTLKAIDAWFPGIGESKPLLVDAGVIFAHGRTDVNDITSGLHNRTKIGVTSVDGYHSVSTGKLTTAPLFAMTVADHVIDWIQ